MSTEQRLLYDMYRDCKLLVQALQPRAQGQGDLAKTDAEMTVLVYKAKESLSLYDPEDPDLILLAEGSSIAITKAESSTILGSVRLTIDESMVNGCRGELYTTTAIVQNGDKLPNPMGGGNLTASVVNSVLTLTL